jgi:glycosyltransferase involved in cell wall biosynthesis
MGSLKLVQEGAKVADRIDGYHALSSHIETTYANFGFPRDRLTVVPNILNERFRREHASDFEEPYELLYVGELAKHKGVDRLVPIIDGLNSRSSDEFRLTVVGDGGLTSEVKRQANERELTSAVAVTGWLPNEELPAVFASRDVFLYPGRWDEPFGRVFLEALATGTPVVASDVGSIAGIIGDGGRTTDGSISGFVDAILSMTSERELAERSVSAKRKAEDYRPETVVPELIELYQRSLAR